MSGTAASTNPAAELQVQLFRAPSGFLDPVGGELRAGFAKELLRTLPNRQKAYNALFRLNDPAFPFSQVNAERLREPPCDCLSRRMFRDFGDREIHLGTALAFTETHVVMAPPRSRKAGDEKRSPAPLNCQLCRRGISSLHFNQSQAGLMARSTSRMVAPSTLPKRFISRRWSTVRS